MNKFKRKMSKMVRVRRYNRNRISIGSRSVTSTREIDVDWNGHQTFSLQIQHKNKIFHRLGENHGYIVPAFDVKTKMKYWVKVLPKQQVNQLFLTMTRNADTSCTVVPQMFGLGYFQDTKQSCLIIQDYGMPLTDCFHLTKSEVKEKIDFCRTELKKCGIKFDETDLSFSHIRLCCMCSEYECILVNYLRVIY